jgi:hypothetical protein
MLQFIYFFRKLIHKDFTHGIPRSVPFGGGGGYGLDGTGFDQFSPLSNIIEDGTDLAPFATTH